MRCSSFCVLRENSSIWFQTLRRHGGLIRKMRKTLKFKFKAITKVHDNSTMQLHSMHAALRTMPNTPRVSQTRHGMCSTNKSALSPLNQLQW